MEREILEETGVRFRIVEVKVLMSMKEYLDAYNIIRNCDESDFCGPRSEDLVQLAEEKLGIVFPPTYRRFITDLGCGAISGQEFYGLINDNFDSSMVPNAVWLNLNERALINFPKYLFIVGETGYGSYYALDLNERDPDTEECPVIECGNCGERGEIIASDFGEFMLNMVQETLE